MLAHLNCRPGHARGGLLLSRCRGEGRSRHDPGASRWCAVPWAGDLATAGNLSTAPADDNRRACQARHVGSIRPLVDARQTREVPGMFIPAHTPNDPGGRHACASKRLTCASRAPHVRLTCALHGTPLLPALSRGTPLRLRPATIDDLALLQHWDEQPRVIASDPNDDWEWDRALRESPPRREQRIADVDDAPKQHPITSLLPAARLHTGGTPPLWRFGVPRASTGARRVAPARRLTAETSAVPASPTRATRNDRLKRRAAR